MAIGAHIAGENPEKKLLFITLQEIAVSQPDNKIIFFTNGLIIDLPHNCVLVNISPKPKNKLLLYYWYKYKLPKLLVKYNIQSFISNSGMLPAAESVKEFLFIEDLFFAEKVNRFFKNKMIDALGVAQTIFVTDEYLEEELRHTFKKIVLKTETLYFSLAKTTGNFTLNEIEVVKEKFSNGFDYYLFPVNTFLEAHIITLLKSFSQLKKWQKTSLKMVLLFENDIDEKLLPDFKNYKYKNDVLLIKQTDENREKLTAAAFAMVFLGNYTRRHTVYEAFYYNIPVIAADTVTNNVLFKSAVNYASLTVEGLALQLQLLYKNETIKNQLIQKATVYLTKFNSNTVSQRLYDIISN